MKSLSTILSGIVILIGLFIPAQGQEFKPSSKSPEAIELFKKATIHAMNSEDQAAYHSISRAVELDPDFSVALLLIGTFTYDESQEAYFERAKKSVSNKSEGEKLLVSLIDTKDKDREECTRVWDKLIKMYPDDKGLNLAAITRETDSSKFLNRLLGYVKRFPSEPSAYNHLGYLYLLYKKDPAKAKTYFEKYIELYPEGYNPYDSMGEYYFITGRLQTAKEYYSKSIEIYPYCISSLQKLEEIDEIREKEQWVKRGKKAKGER
jgi:tetratricopeptide (TPR) repeat protein